MKRRFLTLAAALCLAVCLAVGAEAASIDGYCGADSDGRNLWWTLGSGKLSIGGTGDMAYWEESDDIPWYSSRANIRSVVIGEGVESVSPGAFGGLTALTSAVLPASLKTFDGSAFVGCTSLTGIEVPETSESFTAVNGIVFSKDGAELVCYPCGKPDAAYTVPNGVVSIGVEAFKECSALTELTLSDGVKSIGYEAFSECRALAVVTLPASLTEIGEWAFSACTELTELTLSNGVESIGDLAFSECRALTVVTLPASLTEIGEGAFSGCIELTDVYYGGNVLQGRALDFEHVFFGIDPTIHYAEDATAELVLQEASASTYGVTVSVTTPKAAALYFACYDADGRFLCVDTQPFENEATETLTFYARPGSSRVKLMLLGDENLPLCAAAEASLID